MKAFISLLCLLLAAAPAAISRAETPTASDGLAALAALLAQHNAPQQSGPALTLDEVEQIALTANPEIEVAVRSSLVNGQFNT